MKKNLLFACAALLALTTFNSCKDDDKDPDPAPSKTKTQLLTEKNWKLVALKDDSAGVSTDLYAIFFTEACNKDDESNFDAASSSATSGTYVDTEGATKCDPADPQQTGNGTWAFTNTAQTTMSITEQGGTAENFTILQLDANTLKVSMPGDSLHTLTATFGH